MDIFDAGPTVECDVDDISAVARSHVFKVVVSDAPPADDAVIHLVSNMGIGNYRAMLVAASPQGELLPLNAETAAALRINAGDDVRAVILSVRDRR